jgi:hypothetical protein
MKCSYCVVPGIEKLIIRTWDDIRKELDLILKAGLNGRVFIADGEFNLPSPQYAIALCRRISAEFGTAIRWACYLEAGYVTSELLDAMREAGCMCISLTVDSFSRDTRVGYIKVTKPETAMIATQLCLDAGIHTNINLLFGGPNESLETATNTAQVAKEFNQKGVAASVTVGLRVYPRTPLSIMVTKDKYSRYYKPCSRFNWLGLFCSPVPAKELALHILPILPPSSTVFYTNTKIVEDGERSFYHQIAIGAKLLGERNPEDATKHFAKVAANAPTRLEPQLGLLKAEYDLLRRSKE